MFFYYTARRRVELVLVAAADHDLRTLGGQRRRRATHGGRRLLAGPAEPLVGGDGGDDPIGDPCRIGTEAVDSHIWPLPLRPRKPTGITPATVTRALGESGPGAPNNDYLAVSKGRELDEDDPEALIEALKDEMLMAAAALEFERAANLRDQIKQLAGKGYSLQKKKSKKGGRSRR